MTTADMGETMRKPPSATQARCRWMRERHPLPTCLKDQFDDNGGMAGQVTRPNPLASAFSSLTKDLHNELNCPLDGRRCGSGTLLTWPISHPRLNSVAASKRNPSYAK